VKIDERKIPPAQVPWHFRRHACKPCGGYHAPWWGTTPPPSCRPGHAPGTWNDVTMMLEALKLAGR
jgi:hypothetical protein